MVVIDLAREIQDSAHVVIYRLAKIFRCEDTIFLRVSTHVTEVAKLTVFPLLQELRGDVNCAMFGRYLPSAETAHCAQGEAGSIQVIDYD